jgi:hypothetical protein
MPGNKQGQLQVCSHFFGMAELAEKSVASNSVNMTFIFCISIM